MSAIWKGSQLSKNPMAPVNVLAIVKRSAAPAAVPYCTCCHKFRARETTTDLLNGGIFEHARRIAAHESPRITKLYECTQDEISLDEVERTKIQAGFSNGRSGFRKRFDNQSKSTLWTAIDYQRKSHILQLIRCGIPVN